MKFASKIWPVFAGLLLTVNAMAGTGMGGTGLGKTKLLLQSFAYNEAVLTIDGLKNIPESESTPNLVIPEVEYNELLAELEDEIAIGGKSYVLKVPVESKATRYFVISYLDIDETGPRLLHLEETTVAATVAK